MECPVVKPSMSIQTCLWKKELQEAIEISKVYMGIEEKGGFKIILSEKFFTDLLHVL